MQRDVPDSAGPDILAAAPAHERSPRLEGSRNFRDLGGYRAEDGRHVRWNLLFRSGSLHGLTEEGRAALRVRGIRAFCDLRTTGEREHEPFAAAHFDGVAYWSRDYPTSFADLRSLMARGFATAEEARTAMIAGYRAMPFQQAPAFRQLFAYVVAGDLPLVFNCSAGKDRTGVAAALLLWALGVPRATIVEDFLLTNAVLDLERALRANQSGTISRLPPEISAIITHADVAYLETALDAVTDECGGIAPYLADQLGIDAAMLATIRGRLLA